MVPLNHGKNNELCYTVQVSYSIVQQKKTFLGGPCRNITVQKKFYGACSEILPTKNLGRASFRVREEILIFWRNIHLCTVIQSIDN